MRGVNQGSTNGALSGFGDKGRLAGNFDRVGGLDDWAVLVQQICRVPAAYQTSVMQGGKQRCESASDRVQ